MSKRKPLTFQELIQTLNAYWSAKGCLIMQPYDLEVGAGTFSPHTFLRALGPEPWNAAYVEPSRRPCHDMGHRAALASECYRSHDILLLGGGLFVYPLHALTI